MLERVKDILLGINTHRRAISRRLSIILLGLLQLAGGLILYNTDYTRGTPLIIQQSGIITMPVFSLIMMLAGGITLLLVVFAFDYIDTLQMLFLTTPFIAYMLATVHGAAIGVQGGQGAFIYVIFYFIALNGIWGTD